MLMLKSIINGFRLCLEMISDILCVSGIRCCQECRRIVERYEKPKLEKLGKVLKYPDKDQIN